MVRKSNDWATSMILSVNVSPDGMTQSASATIVTEPYKPPSALDRNFGGRQRGSTNKEKEKKKEIERCDAEHKIICPAMIESSYGSEQQSIFKKNIFEGVLQDERQRMGLSDYFKSNFKTAQARVLHKNLIANGRSSPLIAIEDQLIELLLCMSKIKRSLLSSEGLCLANDLIQGTDVQRQLVQ